MEESVRIKHKISITDVILFIIFLLLLALPGYLCYQLLISANNSQDNQTNESSTTTDTQTTDETEDTDDAQTGPYYSEIVREFDGQTAYIAVPTSIDEDNPPSIVVYNHGSNTTVISDMYDPFMMDLQSYGRYFTQYNYIFAASNAHGENWGNAQSLSDISRMITWIEANFTTSTKLYFIGFSMGGLPTTHYVLQYPENVQKIALLAPTLRTYEWGEEEVDIVNDIEIKIWHGTDDVNIGYSNSVNFVNYMKNLGKDITLVELDGKTHFDVDTEYMDQILEFFNQ